MKEYYYYWFLCFKHKYGALDKSIKNWDKYDIEGFYTIAKSKAEAKISKNVLREGADYYIPTEMDDQVFPSGNQ